MTAVDLPIPVVVTRHQCPHCRRFTRADQTVVQRHMGRCWKNPANRTCKGCAHFSPAYSLEPDAENAYRISPKVWEVDEECRADVDLPDYEQMPVTNCPKWEAAP